MARETSGEDAVRLRIFLLDVGREKYGDCLLVRRGAKTVLIDGSHTKDADPRDGFPSIPQQLETVLGHAPPFRVSLLVVSHCHTDHIGCLPTLVDRGVLTADWALVADDRMGFGRPHDYVPPDAPSDGDRLAAALREEDHAALPDAELADFLSDAAKTEPRYRAMLEALEQAGTKVVRHGRDDHGPLETAFKSLGLKVLGPSLPQLLKCAEAIAQHNQDAQDAVDRGEVSDARDLRELYREIVRGAADVEGEDKPGKGAAINTQSIVLKVGVGKARALLAGDMQFAKPEVSGLKTLMRQLRDAVRDAGPYQFVKIPHHSSYNAFDADLMTEWGTALYGHVGGSRDAGHPERGVLELLEEHRDRIDYARTDRNGIVEVVLGGAKPTVKLSRGALDDFTPNGDVEAPAAGGGEARPERPAGRSSGAGALREVTATARIDGRAEKVTIVISTTPAGVEGEREESGVSTEAYEEAGGDVVRLAPGRTLPRLLFVTHRPELENNLGRLEAAGVLGAVRAAGKSLLEVRNPADPFPEVRTALRDGYEGVVILGGYDVLPSQRTDTLPPSLRAQVGDGSVDADNFIVWSDERYGDVDGDHLGELPVSRIPDAKSQRLVRAALGAASPSAADARFGVRNSARRFAEGPYGLLAGTAPLHVSAPTTASRLGPASVTGSRVYLMLHGSDVDATRFWGELPDGDTIEAVNLLCVPRRFAGVVFTGCCWGALPVQTTAADYVPGGPLGIRPPASSLALSYLYSGATAFVGCTGTHYSPTVAPFRYFGGPMHEAFWKHLAAGEPPAKALYRAKLDYLAGIPHGQTSTTARAIEFKILRQYTCLGLGW